MSDEIYSTIIAVWGVASVVSFFLSFTIIGSIRHRFGDRLLLFILASMGCVVIAVALGPLFYLGWPVWVMYDINLDSKR